jgi:hypothetical protein
VGGKGTTKRGREKEKKEGRQGGREGGREGKVGWRSKGEGGGGYGRQARLGLN